MTQCVMCEARAEVVISWPVSEGEQRHKVCDYCGNSVYDRISKEFSGTEAHLSFTIEPL